MVNRQDKIAPALLGVDPMQQTAAEMTRIDVDGTAGGWKLRQAASASLGVSMAVCRAGGAAAGVLQYRHIHGLVGSPELLPPMSSWDVHRWGAHARQKQAMQDFLILPVGATTFLRR